MNYGLYIALKLIEYQRFVECCCQGHIFWIILDRRVSRDNINGLNGGCCDRAFMRNIYWFVLLGDLYIIGL